MVWRVFDRVPEKRSSMALQGNLGVLIWAAIIGLPISFLCCWLIGAPVLRRIMCKEINFYGAALGGGFIAFLMAFVSIVLGRYRGWRQSLNPNVGSQLGGGDHIREVDGILTTYGWLMLGKSTAMFVAVGDIVALIVRLCIGKPANN